MLVERHDMQFEWNSAGFAELPPKWRVAQEIDDAKHDMRHWLGFPHMREYVQALLREGPAIFDRARD